MNRQYLLIDGLPAMYAAHDHGGLGKLTQIVARLIREGRQFGIHVVASAARRQDVGSVFSKALTRWVILRQGSVDDYRNLEVPTDMLSDESPAGRAIVGRSEAQIAVLGGSAFGDVQARAMDVFGRQLRERGVADADPIRVLPHIVRSREVPDHAWCIDDESLEPVGLPDGLDLLQIVGPRGAGKSTALWRAAACLGQRFDSIDLFTSKPAALPTPSHWEVWRPTTEGAGPRLQEISAAASRRLVLIDDFGPLTDSALGMHFEELMHQARTPNLTVVLAIENVDARSSFKPVIREVRSYRTSLMLRPDPLADGEIGGIELPRVKTFSWPPGRGFLILGNTRQLVQVVEP